ncbi:putative angiogenic factor [Dirofilaria immitis]
MELINEDVNEFIQPNTSEITIEADAEQDNMSIADVLRQTANEFLRDQYLQGFEFHEDCKLYYNPMTGYYYDQDTALFYHPSTNCYYYYDNQADSYVYYTRIPCEHTWTDKLAERKAVALLGESFAAGMTQDEVDVFECLNSLLKIVLQTTDNDSFDCDVLNDEISIYIQEERMGYAPCVRIIEKASGALHVVTITGARIGSASDCEIQLSSEQFSENEYSAVISYNETEQRYFMTVKGREPVIFRNKIKIDMDEVAFIDHGDEWQFGEQEFLAHIHYGTNTCGSCEPGLLKTDHVIISELDYNPLAGKISKETLRRRNLRSMKKEYGIFDDEEERYRCKYQKKERNFSCNNAENKDKSIYANCLAKPLPKMIATTIDKLPSSAEMLNESNRGFGMLQRMGWKQGTGLGRREDGITEPLTSKVRPNRAGLGLKNEVKFELSKKQDKRQHLLEITRKRFQKAEIFAMADDGQDDTM